MEVISRQQLFKRHLRVEEMVVRDGAGTERRLEVVQRRDAVAALVFDARQQAFLLVEQWRAGAEAPLLELPAGIIDEGEMPEAALRRELREELGCTVGELTAIATFYTTPGFCTEQIYLFAAEVAEWVGEGGGLAAEGESLVVQLVPVEVFYKAALYDGKTLVAREWARGRQLHQLLLNLS